MPRWSSMLVVLMLTAPFLHSTRATEVGFFEAGAWFHPQLDGFAYAGSLDPITGSPTLEYESIEGAPAFAYTVVPEPTTAVLLGGGLALIALLRVSPRRSPAASRAR